ncbi:hypothetical protein [Bergeyella porcorum]|uniref:hypothetical protein n=1 Tax=Bergeyella porcorum TaxID=1735111 RepID=UPI002E23CC24
MVRHYIRFCPTPYYQDNTDGVTGSGSKAQISQYTAKGISITWMPMILSMLLIVKR